MSTEKEFKSELAALGGKISASRIESLTKKAIKLTLKQSDFVLETIGLYIQKARKEARLGAMYLIDSLAKSCLKLSEKDENFKNLYYKKLPEKLGELIPILFDCEAKEREKIKKIITIWAQQEKMFLPGFAAHMMKKFEAFGRSNPISAVKQENPITPVAVVKQEPAQAPVPVIPLPAPTATLPLQIINTIGSDLTPLPPPTVGFLNLESLLVEKTSALLENIKLLNGKIPIGLVAPFPESISALLPSSAKQSGNSRSELRHNQSQGYQSDPRQGQSFQSDPRQGQSFQFDPRQGTGFQNDTRQTQGFQHDPRQPQHTGHQHDPRQNYNDQRQQFDHRQQFDQTQQNDPRHQFGQEHRQSDPRAEIRGGNQNDSRGNQFDPRAGYQNDRGNQQDQRGYQNDTRGTQQDQRGPRNDSRGGFQDRGHQQQDYSKNGPGQGNRPERNNRNNELPIPPGPNCEPSYIDPSVNPDSIKILSRTVFISGFPPSMQQTQLKEILETVARIQTIRVNSQKQNAFIKVATRKEAESLQYEFQGFQIDQSYLKVGWASGYGPRENFAYNTGITLFPIRQIPPGDITFIENAPRGGGKVLPSAVMEEPDLPLEVTLGSKKMENSQPKRMNEDGGSGGPPRQRW